MSKDICEKAIASFTFKFRQRETRQITFFFPFGILPSRISHMCTMDLDNSHLLIPFPLCWPLNSPFP